MAEVLRLTGVKKSFGGVKALQGCSFAVEEGKITGLIGPNGAGKTTAFNVITGFLRPDSGSVFLQGEEVTGRKPHLIARRGISRTFQIPRLFHNLSIEENMLMALEPRGWRRSPGREEEEKITQVLNHVGLKKDPQTLASDLSYGQQRLLEIARALAREHTLLLLDEPTAGVNPKLRQELKKLLRELRDKGNTILLIEHDMEFVMDISDEVIVLDAGKFLTTGKPAAVRNDERVLEAYLGN